MNLLSHKYRGIQTDLILFVIQLLLMGMLVTKLAELIALSKEETGAKILVAGFFFCLCFFQPVGILLKRYRMTKVTEADQRDYEKMVNDFGCYYLISQLVLMGTGVTVIFGIFGQMHIFDKICLVQFVIAFLLAVLNHKIVSLYATTPNHRPLKTLLESPKVALLGDLFLLLNMILWQVLWVFLMSSTVKTASLLPDEFIWLSFFLPQSDYTLLARLGWFFLAFVTFYLSPRFIYTIRDGRNKFAWLTILLANSPVIYRIFFGSF